jgi:hypothetical protein
VTRVDLRKPVAKVFHPARADLKRARRMHHRGNGASRKTVSRRNLDLRAHVRKCTTPTAEVSMPHTLWSKGQLLVSIIDLQRGAALPGLPAGVIAGGFEPAPDFEVLAAPLVAMAAISTHVSAQAFDSIRFPDQSQLGDLPPKEAALRVQAALRVAVESNADLQRILVLEESIAELALELRDDAGDPVAASNIRLIKVPADSAAHNPASEMTALFVLRTIDA